MISILIHLESRWSGSGRDGRFAHTSNGHMVCVQGRAVEKEMVEKKGEGAYRLVLLGSWEIEVFRRVVA